MGLSPVKATVATGIPKFATILEVLTGGFTIQTTGFTTGVTLPAGSLLNVDESARTATLVKTAKLSKAYGGSATGLYLEKGHHFIAGEYIGVTVGAKAYVISTITAGTTEDYLVIATAIDAGATGAVVLDSSATGSSAAAIKTAPNALSQFDVDIASGESVSAVIRGTAYKNRVQSHVAGHLTTINHIHFSDSK